VGDPNKPMFFLIELEDGESPVVRSSTDAKNVAQRIQTLDQEDVSVVVVFGWHLPISKGSPRYLFFGDNSAMMIPPAGEIKAVPLTPSDVEIQIDHFLGPTDYTESIKLFEDEEEELDEIEVFDDDEDDFDGEYAE